MKNNKAVTLVALIITVIILLILAGVVIAMTTGDEGIINKSQQAVEKYNEAEAREKLEFELANLLIEKQTTKNYNNEFFDKYLTEKGFIVNDNIVIVDGNQFLVDKSVPEILQTLGKKTESKNIKIEISYDYETQNHLSCLVTIKIKYPGTINTINIAGKNENIPEAKDGVYTITKTIDENGTYGIYVTNTEDEYAMAKMKIENIIGYKIIYNSNGGEGTIPTQRKATGENIAISECEDVRMGNGKIFKEWNTKPDGSGTVYIPGNSYSEDKDLTLYAIWMDGAIFAGYGHEFTDLTWDCSVGISPSQKCLAFQTNVPGTHGGGCKTKMLGLKNYNFLRIKITRPNWATGSHSGLYLSVGSSPVAKDILDSHCLSNYVIDVGETIYIDIPVKTSCDSAYISFIMPVNSGNSYGWEIREISMHN